MFKFLKGLFIKRVHMPMQRPGAREIKVKIDTNPETNPKIKPLIIDGLPYVMVTKDRKTRHGVETACTFEIDEEHEITKECRRLEAMKHKGMLFEPINPRYIIMDVDKKYLGKWGKG